MVPKQEKTGYFIVQNLDMYGGDIHHFEVSNLEEGIEVAKKYINKDPLKCATYW